jgi:hypothetical protein
MTGPQTNRSLTTYNPKLEKAGKNTLIDAKIIPRSHTISGFMEALEELKKWVQALQSSEKRFVKLLGKARAGESGSQLLALFDWLNQCGTADTLPEDADFTRHFSTLAVRLKDLILDSLRLLEKGVNVDAQVRASLDAIAHLYEKGLHAAALRHVKRLKRLAMDCSRHALLLEGLEWERRLTHATAPADLLERLKGLHAESQAVWERARLLEELIHRHDLLRLHARQVFVPRTAKELEEVHALAAGEWIVGLAVSGPYWERALAVNILGTCFLLERNPLAALQQYQPLLEDWKAHPEWQLDQVPLLLSICSCYQMACFHAPLPWEQMQHYLSFLPDYQAMPSEIGRDFLHRQFHGQLTLALNTGNFTSLESLIPQMDAWITAQAQRLTASQCLAFFHNFAVAEFLNGRHGIANRYIHRILNLPQRNARMDIRDFALVLQAIVQYELGNVGLNEYLTRAGKRRFSKYSRELAFEFSVFKFLDLAMKVEGDGLSMADKADALQVHLGDFERELDELALQVPGAVPLLGLMEVRLWARSKATGKALREVFLEAVRENLARMG